jgi:hypothetical protein
MDHAAERQRAIDRGTTMFANGSHWLKTVNGRRFVIELHDDGTLTEWLEDHPDDTWHGRWQISPVWETPEYLVGMQILVGGYEARVRVVGTEPWRGYELPPEGLDAVPPDDRRHEFLYKSHFPTVTLTRHGAQPPPQVALPPVGAA